MADMGNLTYREFLDQVLPQLLDQVTDDANKNAGVKDVQVYWDGQKLMVAVEFNKKNIVDSHQDDIHI